MSEGTAATGDNGITATAIDPGTATTGVTSAPTPTNASIAWLEGADELTVGYAQNKGWQSPNELLSSYQNLEKLLGADRAGNTVVLPKDGATPDELNAFYGKLGRPSDPAGYNIDVPQGIPSDFTNAATAKFHELGLSQKQGQELASWWQGYAGNIAATQEAQAAEAFRADEVSLRQDWGQAYDQNIGIARTVANTLGLDAPTIDKLQAALGHKGTMDLLYKIGEKSGEDVFVTSQTGAGFRGAMTPAQAKAEISQLQQDRDFVSKYLNKDANAIKRMAELHSFAYPE